jgi:hypothetical protein
MSNIPGLIDSIEYRQHERTDELNDRIYQRIHSDNSSHSYMKPLYNPRPCMTKHSVFPIVDLRKDSTVSLKNHLDYSTDNHFAPIQCNGPVDGYFRNIAVEMELRNQYFALSSANQRYYVPSSNSDLYRTRSVAGSLNEEQPYPYLFTKPSFDSSDHPIDSNIGSLTFFNDTRAQLRGDGI